MHVVDWDYERSARGKGYFTWQVLEIKFFTLSWLDSRFLDVNSKKVNTFSTCGVATGNPLMDNDFYWHSELKT